MKTIDTEQLKELGKLYLKHSKKKKKLFGGEKLKLNDNDFWFELVSIDWFKELFDLSIDVTIEDFEHWDEEKYGFSFNNKLAVGEISKEIAKNNLTLEDIEDLATNVQPFKSSSMINYYLKELQKTEGIKFVSIEKEKKAAREKEKKAARAEAEKEKTAKIIAAGAEVEKEKNAARVAKAEKERLKQEAAEAALKERIIKEGGENGEEIWKSYKKKELCYDMPIEFVRLMKGKEGQKKQSASKSSGTKTQLFYGKKTSKRGSVSYTSRIDFENGLCSGWTDL